MEISMLLDIPTCTKNGMPALLLVAHSLLFSSSFFTSAITWSSHNFGN